MRSTLPTVQAPPAGANLTPSRRSFLRYTGASAVVGSLWLAGCKKDEPQVTPAPTITSFTPTSGAVGTTVTLTGTAFTGTGRVTLGTTDVQYTVVNDTTITFPVPSGATTGVIAVVTPGGTFTTSTSFTVTTAAAATVSLGTGDIGVLNYAYALEQLEAAFYTQLRTGTYYTGLGATSAERQILDDLYYHEVIHRELFKAALSTNAIKGLTPNFSAVDFNSRTSVLATAKAFEDLGVAAYNGAGQYISTPSYLFLAGKIVSVEARHAALIRDLVQEGTFVGNDIATITTGNSTAGNPNYSPAGSSLERSMAPNDVVAIANTFLADGSKLALPGTF